VHWLVRIAGLDDPTGPVYLFWSGIGADLGEFAIVAVIWHHLNCHVKGCWRIAGHRNPQTGFRSCMRHRRIAQVPPDDEGRPGASSVGSPRSR
jgi:hypothetical protein